MFPYQVISEGKVLTPLFRITVAWEVGNGQQAVKVYEAKSPQQAWQAAVLETVGLPMDMNAPLDMKLAAATGSAGTMGFPMNTAGAGAAAAAAAGGAGATAATAVGSGGAAVAGSSGVSGDAGIGDGDEGVAMDVGEGQAASQGQGQGQGQGSTLLMGSDHFLDMPNKSPRVAGQPPQQPLSSSSTLSASASASGVGSGTGSGLAGSAVSSANISGNGGGSALAPGVGVGVGVAVADDVYEEPDEEEMTLRLQLVELRKAYFRTLRHEQSMGYHAAVTPRLSREVGGRGGGGRKRLSSSDHLFSHNTPFLSPFIHPHTPVSIMIMIFVGGGHGNGRGHSPSDRGHGGGHRLSRIHLRRLQSW